MKITVTQALACVESLSKGAPKHYFDAILGIGGMPKVEDFQTHDAAQLEKCDEFLDSLQQILDTLVAFVRDRPRQTTLVPSADGSKLETKGLPIATTANDSATATPKYELPKDRKNRIAREKRAAAKKKTSKKKTSKK